MAVGAIAFGVLASATSGASAASFSELGAFRFDGDAVVKTNFASPISTPAGALEIERREDEAALAGGWVGIVPVGATASMALTIDPDFAAFSQELHFWLRGGEAQTFVRLIPVVGPPSVLGAFPTGRVTSDGWVEFASTVVVGITGAKMELTIENGGAEIAVDAVEVIRGLEALDGRASCDGLSDVAACNAGSVCVEHSCRPANPLVPTVVDERVPLARYLQSRVELFYGSTARRITRGPLSATAFDAMTVSFEPFAYWTNFQRGLRALADPEHQTNFGAAVRLPAEHQLDACFIIGAADATQGQAGSQLGLPDVLVSHVGVNPAFGLQAGDRLVSVDGVHPITWLSALEQVVPHAVAPRPSTRVRQLPELLVAFAHEIEVVTCAGTLPCGPATTVAVGDVPVVDGASAVTCDHRPRRHADTAPLDHRLSSIQAYASVADVSDVTEAIWTLELDGLDGNDAGSGVNPDLATALAQVLVNARGLVIDHRTGLGGEFVAVDRLWGFAMPPTPVAAVYRRRFAEEGVPTPMQAQALFDAAALQQKLRSGGRLGAPLLPIALLVTEAQAESEWLALGLSRAAAAGATNLRVFGPERTEAGYGTAYGFGYWGGVEFELGFAELILPNGELSSHSGASMTEVVLPSQTALLGGGDPVFDAAVTWLRGQI